MAALGFRVGVLVIDAKHFLPQSRERVFIFAVREDLPIPAHLIAASAQEPWHPPTLQRAVTRLSLETRKHGVWWRLPLPPPRTTVLADLLEPNPDVRWTSDEEVRAWLSRMAPAHRERVADDQRSGRLVARTIAKRGRGGVTRFELRADEIAGCLLAPKGGASISRILMVEGSVIRSRPVSRREAARLMGMPDEYMLPENYWDAMRLVGDGVAVPVVRHLVRHLVLPILSAAQPMRRMA